MSERADTQNVTLSLPKAILRKAKVLAAQRQTSLSALLTVALVDMIGQQEAYELARTRALQQMQRGYPMGTGGRVTWTRDELHER